MKFVQITDTHMVPPVLRLWGLDPRARLEACVADINGDGTVDGADLAALLAGWGACP